MRIQRLDHYDNGGWYSINAVDAAEFVVDIPDPALQSALENQLRKQPDETITSVELAKLTFLDARHSGITDLTGLQFTTNLRELQLQGNSISNLAPLSDAESLEYLKLGENSISDFSPLMGLKHLRILYLDSNSISDLPPLSGLARLGTLHLESNSISNLAPLSGLPRLNELYLGNNFIVDVAPLAELVNLEDLNLRSNSIPDISPLAGLTGLIDLNLASNSISDVSALAGLTTLNVLNLETNKIPDISPLAGLTRIFSLNLAFNSISDISPLAGLTDLSELYLQSNQISDISPLDDLTNLQLLYLRDNSISDISALANLDALYELDLGLNQIMDIAPLAGLTRLRELNLQGNLISDIAPLARNEGLGRYTVVHLQFNPLAHRSVAEHLHILVERGLQVLLNDDHGDAFSTATALSLGGAEKGVIIEADVDYFRLEITEAAEVRIFTTGAPDAYGELLDSEGDLFDPDARHGRTRYGEHSDYVIERHLEPGVYFVTVRTATAGAYLVHALETRANRLHAPLFLASTDTAGEGFVRVINHDAKSGEARIHAVDDSGWMTEPLTLSFASRQTRHFNSTDLESGNPMKGLSGAAGRGRGYWRLEFESDLDLEVLAYARTPDGFLTSMHDVAPWRRGLHQVAILNPGKNEEQVSTLRLGNPDPYQRVATIYGVDDSGQRRTFNLGSYPKHSARNLTARQMEGGGEMQQQGFGAGTGKWRLSVNPGQQPLVVMSLVRSPTGHLTNLSSWPENQIDGAHRIRLFPAADDGANRQGFARVINLSDQAGEVRIDPMDDTGWDYNPITMALEPGKTEHFNSTDLEQGNPSKGLSDGVGDGMGDWRLRFSSDLDIAVLAYIRTTEDGFLTSMDDIAPSTGGDHRILIFNPASNTRQVSYLHLINLADEVAEITVRGIDDSGASPGTEVRLMVPARETRQVSAQQLETGDADLQGALGDGEGKWQLIVSSAQPIEVMSLLENPTGHLTNLSTAPGRVEEIQSPR